MARVALGDAQFRHHAEQAQQVIEPQEPVATGPQVPKSMGTIGLPYERKDGVQTVKLSWRAGMKCAGRLKTYVAMLEMEGISRNEWLDRVVMDAISRGLR